MTTKDTLIDTRKSNLGRDDVATLKKNVHIPNLTVGQTYWLGVIIDYTKKIEEVNESSNVAYIPIQVTCCDRGNAG